MTECSLGECLVVEKWEDGSVDIFSNRRPHEAVLAEADEWQDFIKRVKDGEFD